MTEANKATIRRHLLEGVSGHQPEVWDQIMDPGFVEHFGTNGMAIRGRAAYQKILHLYWKAFPDLNSELVHLISEGDYVCLHYVERGTHTGPWGTTAPTGRSYAKNGFGLYHVVDGLMVEAWIQEDDRTFMDQLGWTDLELG